MKVIFISGSYRNGSEWGIQENIRKAEDAAIRLWKLGWVVLCPHKNSANFGGVCDDSVWLDGYLELVRRSDAIYLLKGWHKSVGSRAERKLADELGIAIYEERHYKNPIPPTVTLLLP